MTVFWMAALLPAGAMAQDAPPLPPYVPPATQSPLAPLPGQDAADGAATDLGQVRLKSDAASNTSSADTRSTIAPVLPEPATAGHTTADYLRAARAALAAGQTGAAQEALERAESLELNRDVAPSEAGTPSADPLTSDIAAARQALSVGNLPAAQRAIDTGLGRAGGPG